MDPSSVVPLARRRSRLSGFDSCSLATVREPSSSGGVTREACPEQTRPLTLYPSLDDVIADVPGLRRPPLVLDAPVVNIRGNGSSTAAAT